MKKRLMLIGAILMIGSLTACNSNENTKVPEERVGNVKDGDENLDKGDTIEQDSNQEEVKENKIDENINKDKEEEKENENEKEEEKEEQTEMSDEVMIENSDYIAKVKMIQKGQNKFELKVLENIKGSINASDVPNTENFQQNRAYVIFLRDVNGTIEPTNGNKSYILLEGDNHEIFEKINKHVNR